MPEHVPLYRPGNNGAQTDKAITFVFGKAVSSTGTISYGWINRAMLVATPKAT